MDMRAHQIIYVTTNKINQKSYVGYHSTNNLEDNYLGSGVYLTRAIKKYGRENFERKILEFCDVLNWEERETFWIAEKNTKYPNGYNLTDGGEGGIGKIVSNETKELMSKIRIERNLAKGENNGMFAKHHTAKSKENMSKTRKLKGSAAGKNNPRFDSTIYNFKNLKSNETFIGHKLDLAILLHTHSCYLTRVINGDRPHYKFWVLEK